VLGAVIEQVPRGTTCLQSQIGGAGVPMATLTRIDRELRGYYSRKRRRIDAATRLPVGVTHQGHLIARPVFRHRLRLRPHCVITNALAGVAISTYGRTRSSPKALPFIVKSSSDIHITPIDLNSGNAFREAWVLNHLSRRAVVAEQDKFKRQNSQSASSSRTALVTGLPSGTSHSPLPMRLLVIAPINLKAVPVPSPLSQ
jgi:hypothetical protein